MCHKGSDATFKWLMTFFKSIHLTGANLKETMLICAEIHKIPNCQQWISFIFPTPKLQSEIYPFFLQLIQHNLVNATSLRKACVAIMQTNRHTHTPPHIHAHPHPHITLKHSSPITITRLSCLPEVPSITFPSYHACCQSVVPKALVKFEKLNSSTFKEKNEKQL